MGWQYLPGIALLGGGLLAESQGWHGASLACPLVFGVCLAWQNLARARRPLLIAITILVGLAPWICYVNLIALAILAERAIGHWPQPSLDDPKFIDAGPLYDHLYSLVGWTIYAVPVGFFYFPLCLWLAGRNGTRTERAAFMASGGIGLIGFVVAFPLINWWND